MSNCPQPGQKEIRDLLPKHLRDLSTIGRLDRDSEGIILLTNDGRVAKYYLAAEKPHERSYHVWIDAPLHIGQKKRLESGVILSGKKTKPCKISYISQTCLHIQLWEGKNRQIRRMLQKVDRTVTRLKRVHFDGITCDGLEPGEWKIVQTGP